ncbi:Uncharacterised protein [Serratia fonticola]|nr:Uncharacterised protein [Serratia fonticola]
MKRQSIIEIKQLKNLELKYKHFTALLLELVHGSQANAGNFKVHLLVDNTIENFFLVI